MSTGAADGHKLLTQRLYGLAKAYLPSYGRQSLVGCLLVSYMPLAA